MTRAVAAAEAKVKACSMLSFLYSVLFLFSLHLRLTTRYDVAPTASAARASAMVAASGLSQHTTAQFIVSRFSVTTARASACWHGFEFRPLKNHPHSRSVSSDVSYE